MMSKPPYFDPAAASFSRELNAFAQSVYADMGTRQFPPRTWIPFGAQVECFALTFAVVDGESGTRILNHSLQAAGPNGARLKPVYWIPVRCSAVLATGLRAAPHFTWNDTQVAFEVDVTTGGSITVLLFRGA